MPASKTTARTKKKSPATTRKKSPATTKKRPTRQKSKTAAVESFRLARTQDNFFSVQPSIQTLYWIIIGVLVIGLAAWTLALQIQITEIYDSIDMNTQVELPTKSTRS